MSPSACGWRKVVWPSQGGFVARERGPILAANGLRLFGTVAFFPPCDRLRLGCESRYLPLTKCFSTSRLEKRTKESNMCASARGVYPPARNESKGASLRGAEVGRSEEQTSELQSLMRISYAD